MVSIDYSTHPHIIDRIFEAAPLYALLRLRAASTAFRDLADKQLCRHAAVSTVQQSDTVHLHAPNKSSPFVVGRQGVRLPFIPSAVETLDICSDSEGSDDIPDSVLAQFSGVTTLRRFGDHPLLRPCTALGRVDTVVDCLDFSSDGRPKHYFVIPSPPARRHVYHIQWEEKYSPIHTLKWYSPQDLSAASTPVDVVIVLWPYCFLGGKDRHTDMLGPLGPSAECEAAAIRHIRFLAGMKWLRQKITLVGIERYYPLNRDTELRADERTVSDEQYLAFAERCRDIFFRATAIQDVDYNWAADLNVLTYSQWLATLSEEEQTILCPPNLALS